MKTKNLGLRASQTTHLILRRHSPPSPMLRPSNRSSLRSLSQNSQRSSFNSSRSPKDLSASNLLARSIRCSQSQIVRPICLVLCERFFTYSAMFNHEPFGHRSGCFPHRRFSSRGRNCSNRTGCDHGFEDGGAGPTVFQDPRYSGGT